MSTEQVFLNFIDRYDDDTKKVQSTIEILKTQIHKDITVLSKKTEDIITLMKGDDYGSPGLVKRVSQNEKDISKIIEHQSVGDARREEQKLNKRVTSSESDIEEIKLKYMSKNGLYWAIGLIISILSVVETIRQFLS